MSYETEVPRSSAERLVPRTRNNFRRVIGTLFRFAKARGYASQHHSGIAQVEKASDEGNEIGVFTPDALMTLLRVAPKPLVPCVALGAFGGIRSEEIKRLDWSDFRGDDHVIEIKASKAKNRVRRPLPSDAPHHRKLDEARAALPQVFRPDRQV